MRNPFLMFLFGLFGGAVLASAILAHVVTKRVEAANQAATARNEDAAAQNQAELDKLGETQQSRLALDRNFEAQMSADLRSCLEKVSAYDAGAAVEDSRAKTQAHLQSDWYTVLYEPGPASDAHSGPDVFAVLDVVRPGLGKTLKKLQPPPASAGNPLRIRWVFKGWVTPASAPPDGKIEQISAEAIRNGTFAYPVSGQPPDPNDHTVQPQ